MLSISLKCLTGFIKQHPLGGRPIEQFPTILGVSSYIWNLLQAISESSWDCFKVLPQTNAPTLVEAIRTVYGPNPISTPSPDVEMDVDAPEAGEVAFTLVTNKKRGKEKTKASFFFFLNHQFVTRCSIAVHGRLSTTSSLQF